MSLKIFACGDIVNLSSKKDFADENLKELIQECDVSICNFEAPIETKYMQPINKAGPHIYQSKNSIIHLKNMGFDLVSLANNHIYDYGQKALENTINELKQHSIEYVGAGKDFKEAYQVKILEKNSIKVGFLAACENEFGCLYENQNRGGYAWINHYLIEDKIRELKLQVDFIIFIAHTGVENINIPIKEWRDRYKRLCDVGVDIVIAHHPHVPQGYEKYNDNMIFYSLGNFYFDTVGYENKSDDSYSIVLKMEKNKRIDLDIVYHKKISKQTCKVEKEQVCFNLNYLNSLLQNGYNKLNNKICIEAFNKYYYSYYKDALKISSQNLSVLQKIKNIIKKVFFKNRVIDEKLFEESKSKNKYLLLLHNIRIDSHRYVVQRALSLISEKGKN